jgi:hypothetical protein
MMMMMIKRTERVHTRQDDKHSPKETHRPGTKDELAWERGKWPVDNIANSIVMTWVLQK